MFNLVELQQHRDLEPGLLRANTTDTDVTPSSLQYIRSDGGEIDIMMWHIDGFLASKNLRLIFKDRIAVANN